LKTRPEDVVSGKDPTPGEDPETGPEDVDKVSRAGVSMYNLGPHGRSLAARLFLKFVDSPPPLRRVAGWVWPGAPPPGGV